MEGSKKKFRIGLSTVNLFFAKKNAIEKLRKLKISNNLNNSLENEIFSSKRAKYNFFEFLKEK